MAALTTSQSKSRRLDRKARAGAAGVRHAEKITERTLTSWQSESANTVAVALVRFCGAKADEASLTRPLARKVYLRSWRR
ncbi:hypothetical protein ACFVJ4_36745 [Streptomyces sp. NPDC127178]|uniref:hypothetical protein n=1 Tax=unclassified Streptomyces TaxID=2593676 RepID=UPI00363AADFB